MEALHSIDGGHVMHALFIGIAAGVVFQIARNYILMPLESALGVPPSSI